MTKKTGFETGTRHISVRGAREHNLRNVNVDLPRDSLVVITGLSGSGKSSLAFDTIYAEGQRRYVESLSAYARQFLEMMQKPDVDLIEGLSPAISIEQKTTSRNPRSTVGTVTEIYDYMRLLWARVGVPYSPATGLPITSQTVSQMVDIILAMGEGTRLYLLAPVIRGRKGEYRKEMTSWLQKGFGRARIDGELYELDSPPALDKKKKHDIEIVVDRLVIKKDQKHWQQGWPIHWKPLLIWQMVWSLRMMQNPASARFFLPVLPVRFPALPLMRLSRACFPLITLLGLVPLVTGWGCPHILKNS